jgi:hypothetical protein
MTPFEQLEYDLVEREKQTVGYYIPKVQLSDIHAAWTANRAEAVKWRKVADDLAISVAAQIEETCDYMKINRLGDPEKQHNIKLGRSALAAFNEAKG